MAINQQDLNALTDNWQHETNSLNDYVDSAFKSAQDHAYTLGYRRGQEGLIEIGKQRDDLLAALELVAAEVTDGVRPTSSDSHLPSDIVRVVHAAIAAAKGGAA